MAEEQEGQDGGRQTPSGGMSRENSLTSLPETEHDFDLQTREVMPDTGVQAYSQEFSFHEIHDATGAWEYPLAPAFSYFTVTYLGGIEVRVGPHIDAPHTGLILGKHEMFSVSEEVLGNDGRIYLRLADGSGWVFDDAALFPHDPSVVRCLYTVQVPTAPPCIHAAPTATTPEIQAQHPLLTFQGEMLPPPCIHAAPTATTPEIQAQHPLPTFQGEMLPPPCIHAAPTATTTEIQAQHPLLTFQGEMLPPPPVAPPPPLPSGELLASTPLAVASSPSIAEVSTSSVLSPPIVWFRVAYLGGIQVRCAPSIEAPCTGIVLPQNETFPVCEEIPGADGRTYLRLCDGSGWVFDDTALMPHDPSVKRGHWLATNQCAPQQQYPARVLGEVQVGTLPLRQGRLRPQPRGKRGGKKIAKYRSATAQHAQSSVER